MWRKIVDSTLGLGFTIAGSIIVIITLSGNTQRIAIWVTIGAVIAHYATVLMNKDD